MKLTDITSEKRRAEVLDVLNNPRPLHNQRVWLAGNLGDICGNAQEVFELIDELNKWENYDPRKTLNQVRSIVK